MVITGDKMMNVTLYLGKTNEYIISAVFKMYIKGVTLRHY
jgi:hypothetical protein